MPNEEASIVVHKRNRFESVVYATTTKRLLLQEFNDQ